MGIMSYSMLVLPHDGEKKMESLMETGSMLRFIGAFIFNNEHVGIAKPWKYLEVLPVAGVSDNNGFLPFCVVFLPVGVMLVIKLFNAVVVYGGHLIEPVHRFSVGPGVSEADPGPPRVQGCILQRGKA